METIDFKGAAAGQILEADVVVVGGGPAGLSVASELAARGLQVIVLESGTLQESEFHEGLNAVEMAGTLFGDGQVEKRSASHGSFAPSWSNAVQPYGVRCRVLGGSSHAWAGKAASFEPIDFETRPWAPNSGWPVSLEALEPFIARAADRLNLGPNVHGDELWSIIGAEPPEPALNPDRLRTFFWQFSRSRSDPFEATRFGPEFIAENPRNIRLITNATATGVRTNAAGNRFDSVEFASPEDVRGVVRAGAAVIAASGIENCRLLLGSNDVQRQGLGNAHDVVGRYLIDHPAASIARFSKAQAGEMVKRFGFQGVPSNGRMHMYMHGLALAPEVQREEGLLNAALFMLEEHADDDPLIALKRLLKGDSRTIAGDFASVMGSPMTVAKGLGVKVFQSGKLPGRFQDWLIDAIIKANPNFAVRETLNRGVQYKLTGLRVEGITEQTPDAQSRVTLSERKDRFGIPMARIDWRVDALTRKSLVRLGQLFGTEIESAGLPRPMLEDWVAQDRQDEIPFIDMAHTMGTTRMADDPRKGVVDANCQVHGVEGLFIAGGSVFPTGSHVNPTLMIVALSMRLADHLTATASSWNSRSR